MTPDTDIQFDCPLCSGAFEAPADLLGQEVECPHCGQAVELPTAEELSPEQSGRDLPGPPSAAEVAAPISPAKTEPEPKQPTPRPKPEASAQPEPKRPLTREEREAARRRFNLILAAAGAVILALAFVILANAS